MDDTPNMDAMLSAIDEQLGGQPATDPSPVEPESAPEPSPEDQPPVNPTPGHDPRADPVIGPRPDTWKSGPLQHWATLPEEVRAEIMRRENDMKVGLGQYRENAQLGQGFVEVLKPHASAFQGLEPINVIKDLVGAFSIMRSGSPEQKMEVLRQAAQQFGVQLPGAVPGQGPAPQTQWFEQQIHSLKQQLEAAQNVGKSLQTKWFNQELEAFANNPDHLYFNEVVPEMARLFEQGLAQTLEEAYGIALARNPSIQERELDRRMQSKLKAQEEEAARTSRAKKQTLKSAPKSGPVSAPAGATLESTIAETLAEIRARA